MNAYGDHFWIVGGNDNAPWSAAAALAASRFDAGYVAPDHPAYLAFLARGDMPSRIASEAELRDLDIAIVDGLDLLTRVSDQKYAALRAAEAQSPQVARWFDMLRIRGRINLFSAASESAKAGLIGAGLLTQAEADAIFAP